MSFYHKGCWMQKKHGKKIFKIDCQFVSLLTTPSDMAIFYKQNIIIKTLDGCTIKSF